MPIRIVTGLCIAMGKSSTEGPKKLDPFAGDLPSEIKNKEENTMSVEETLNNSGSVWIVSTSSWTGTERLSPGDLDKDPTDIPDIFKLGSKYIIPNSVRLALQGAPQRVRGFMNTVGHQYLPEIKSAWFVPDKYLLTAKKGLEKILAERMEVVNDVITEMPQIREKMIEEYPVLADVEWPSEEAIRKKFSIKWIVFEVSGISANQTDPDALIEAKQEFRQDLADAYAEYKDTILKETKTAIIEACEDISNRILETGDAVTKATLNRPRKIIEKYMTVATMFDLDEVKVKIAELKEVVDRADAKEIRDQWDVAKKLGENLRKLGDDIGDLSGLSSDGRAKRRIKFEKAA